MASIKLTNKQLRLIQRALDLYSRIGTLQLETILDHPSVSNIFHEKHTPKKEFEIGDETVRGTIVEIGEGFIKTKGHWGNGEEIKTWTDIENIKLSPNWNEVHKYSDYIQNSILIIKRALSSVDLGNRGSLGIHNKSVDDSCREAFDIVQVIRHEFWKENTNRSNATVDSNISLITDEPNVVVELDDLKEIRKQKINKINK